MNPSRSSASGGLILETSTIASVFTIHAEVFLE
jgi:hypothetical protein